MPQPHTYINDAWKLRRRCGCPCPWFSAPEIMENLTNTRFFRFILCENGNEHRHIHNTLINWIWIHGYTTLVCLYFWRRRRFNQVYAFLLRNGNTSSLVGIITCYLWKIYDLFVQNNEKFLYFFI